MDRLLNRIEHALAALGGEGFLVPFLDLAETAGADQIMIFALGQDRADCLVSRHFSRARLGPSLAARYLDGWWRHDPLLPALRAVPEGAVEVAHMEDAAARMTPDYREIFFDGPGLARKTALLAAGREVRLIVNLYQTGGARDLRGAQIAPLLGRLALLHFDRPAGAALPSPLAALSSRERAVCRGILDGKTADAIARDMGLAPSTVVTYRKRAYQKLGVTSRGALFAICRR